MGKIKSVKSVKNESIKQRSSDLRPNQSDKKGLRKGWTTGACATAATKAALEALLSGQFPDPVSIVLPKGQTPSFPLVFEELSSRYASAAIVKDAGDDPDVTHLATIQSKVEFAPKASGIIFRAGPGVGVVTLSGLPVEVGQPAINPVPRAMMIEVIETLCATYNVPPDVIVTISIADGEKLAEKTWNPRLGIIGGLSILGTTGIVNPFSCSAWIHSIHRGIDVSRAMNISHVLAATGSTSRAAAETLHNFSPSAILDMGDFVGGTLKYLRKHPIPRLTLAGGFAKFSKLAQGAMDLHSGRSRLNMEWLAELTRDSGGNVKLADDIRGANTALKALEMTQKSRIDLPACIAREARKKALVILRNAPVQVEVVIVSRTGKILAHHDWKSA